MKTSPQDDPRVGVQEFEEEDDGLVIEEVRLTVSKTDDPSLPCATFRVWTIGLLICSFLAFVNQFFWFRTAPIVISALAGQIVSLYLGRLMARWIPNKKIGRWSLNPGPFNIKEHVMITLFANCGSTFGHAHASAIDLVTLLNVKFFFNRSLYGSLSLTVSDSVHARLAFIDDGARWTVKYPVQARVKPQRLPIGAALLLVLTTQTMGYGLAGLCRKYLVDPPDMWWPVTLVDVSLFRTLHGEETKKGLSRLQFFTMVATVSFAWFIVPDYLFFGITSISWICWVWRKNVTAHQVGAGTNGLGFSSFAFDWATISSSFFNSPLATPRSTLLNHYGGFLMAAYIIVPIVYWNNWLGAQRYPIMSNKLFLSNGHRYVPTEVLSPGGLHLDEEKYKVYGPPHMTATFAVVHWCLNFAFIPSVLCHVLLWNGKDMYSRFKKSREKSYSPDIHTRLMMKYPDIPQWWFWCLLVVNLGVAMMTIELWTDTFQIRWYWILVATAMAGIALIPVGIITATTNIFHGIGPLCDIVYGYVEPGKMAGLNSFRVYAAGSIVQAVAFLRNFKLGHYMKIPPRQIVYVQVLGTVVAGVVNLGCAYWIFETEPTLCEETGQWTCPDSNNSFSLAIVWSLIGTKRMFGPDSEYRNLPWFVFLGILGPVVPWAISRASPKLSFLKWVHVPVILASATKWPPARAVNYHSWFFVGIIFQHFVFKYRKEWWQRYNYVMSAALDTGVALAGPLIFLALEHEKKDVGTWWGSSTTYLDHCPLAVCPTAPGINVTEIYPQCPVF